MCSGWGRGDGRSGVTRELKPSVFQRLVRWRAVFALEEKTMNKTIAALAILKASWEARRHSYMDNFNLLVADCLRRSREDLVSGPDVCACLESSFGLKLPLKTVDALLVRASKTGFVTREHGVYKINRTKADTVDFEAKRNSFLENWEDFIGDLVAFSKDKFAVDWSIGIAENAAHDFIDRNSLKIAQMKAGGSYLSLPRKATKSEQFIFASYVNNLVDHDTRRFNGSSLF